MRERERERENVHALITVTFEEIVQVRMQVNKSIKDPMAKRNSSQQQKRPRKIRKHNPLRNTRGSFQIKISLYLGISEDIYNRGSLVEFSK